MKTRFPAFTVKKYFDRQGVAGAIKKPKTVNEILLGAGVKNYFELWLIIVALAIYF